METEDVESNNKYPLVPKGSGELVKTDVNTLLQNIRPMWQSRSLIDRVRRLLPTDPSSACQRLLNAAIHDLREKVVIAGVDIAGQAAKEYGLGNIARTEDVEEFPTAKLLELCYRMGLLTRAEWRKLSRAYEIRRDLEHEDNEYEAGLEDCIYIFKTSIDIVLSRDPIHLLKVTDIKDVVENPTPLVLSEQLSDDFQHAPQSRQEEITRFLISWALDPTRPDIVRQNSLELLRHLESRTLQAVKIATAQHIQERIGRKELDVLNAKVALACGALPYLRQTQVYDFFSTYFQKMKQVGYKWGAYANHTELLEDLEDVGGLKYCPEDLQLSYLKWLFLAYIGEPSIRHPRPVFYSNNAAPIVKRLLQQAPTPIKLRIQPLASDDKDIIALISNKFVARRFEELLDLCDEGSEVK